jgi:hypothetical protein
MLIIILFGFLLIHESHCQSIPADFAKVVWLVGTWVNEREHGNIYESWTVKNKNELQGFSYLISGQDTIVKETMRLVVEHDSIFYIPTVKNQNEGKPIRFALTHLSDTEMRFENPEHDFPQVISYRKKSDNSLLAEIGGTREGEIRKIQFPMRRLSF